MTHTEVTATPLRQMGNIVIDKLKEQYGLSEDDWHRMQLAAYRDPSTRSSDESTDAKLYEDILDLATSEQENDGPLWREAEDDFAQSNALFLLDPRTWLSGPKTIYQEGDINHRAARDAVYDANATANAAEHAKAFEAVFGRPPDLGELDAWDKVQITEARLMGIDPAARPIIMGDAVSKVLGTPAARTLLDQQYAILFGSLESSIVIAGVVYTPEFVNRQSAADREMLATAWIAYNDPKGIAAALQAERDLYEETHPEYNEYKDWASEKRKEWADYGGAKGYRQRASEVNPGAKAYYEETAKQLKADHPDWSAAKVAQGLDAATFSVDAYLAIFGYEVRYGDKSKGNSEDPVPRGWVPAGGAPAQEAEIPVSLATVKQGTELYQAAMAQANAILSATLGRPVDYLNSPPPFQATYDEILVAAGFALPKGSEIGKDYLDWKAKQESVGKNSSMAAYVAMVQTTGGDWKGHRTTVNMGGWNAVVDSGGQEPGGGFMSTKPSGMGQGFTRNNDRTSVNGMGQHLTVNDFHSGTNALGQRITQGERGGGGTNAFGQRTTRGG